MGRLNSIWIFFIALSVVMVGLILLFLKPQPSLSTKGGEFAKIEVQKFHAFQTSTASTDFKIEGSRALQYSDHEVLYDFTLSKFDPQTHTQEHAKGEVVVRKNDLYTFPKGVLYTTSNNESFWSQKGTYDHRKQIFEGQGYFYLNAPEGDVKGDDIIYNHVAKTLQAKHIHAVIDLANAQQSSRKSPTGDLPF
ncbi:hypothetical protein [Helicobacter bizzozeronii]|uniref:hypothetical protein n=1 Tax=Helicobacter bizzozeronii TaxID=56877 RepID=UPI001F158472|nr:hypothetical protein [Helicobacter bizzozeronii]